MSRRRTKAEDIRNPEHYFKRYIACERKKKQEEDAEYYDLHESLDSMVERASAGYDRSAYQLFSVNLENEEIEDALAKRNLLGWIDQIENPKLHKAVSSLSMEKKILLTLRYQYQKTQQEVSKIMHIGQQAVSKSERGILKEIKKFFK